MKYFAKIDDNNLVLSGLAVSDEDCNNGDEATGSAFLANLTGWSKWKIYDPEVDKGMAIGGTYDPSSGDFISKKPADNFTWNSTYKIWMDPADGGALPE
tara:strand:+ start:262 stop:558 length:297 start_codon:yes stop_codon:yes gene_type:complete